MGSQADGSTVSALEECPPWGLASRPAPHQHGRKMKARFNKGQGARGGKGRENGEFGFSFMKVPFGLKPPGSH